MAEEARLMASYEEAKSVLLRDGELIGHMQEELRQLEHGIGQALTTMEVSGIAQTCLTSNERKRWKNRLVLSRFPSKPRRTSRVFRAGSTL